MQLYLYYFMLTIKLGDYSRATTVPSIRKGDVERIWLPLPPLAEQKRIVAKLEELFTKLDAGVEALKKIKAQLKRYRQAVLKHAFEGKLTERWRNAHKGELESTSILLQRLAKEREKTTKGKKQKKLPPLDVSELPELPEGWEWAMIGAVSEMIQYGTSEKASRNPSGIPVIRMGNIGDGKLSFENLKYFPRDWADLQKFLLCDGDVLFNRTNSAELVGKTAVYKRCHPRAVFASYLIRVKVDERTYIPDLLASFINSFYGRQYISSVVSQQVGQANVNGTKLSHMPIPLPPWPEQCKIVEEIERHFSIADQIGQTIEHGLKQSDWLRQSILKKAFEGKLVPQDPEDEPAEKLLERIKVDKAKLQTGQQAKRKPLKKFRKKANATSGEDVVGLANDVS
jgi:type I restriction enzyme S subunit